MYHCFCLMAICIGLTSCNNGAGNKEQIPIQQGPQIQPQQAFHHEILKKIVISEARIRIRRCLLMPIILDAEQRPIRPMILMQGGEIEYLGVKMQRKQGLDFTCLTDHAEYLGVNQLLIDTTNPLSKSPMGMLVNSGNKDSAFKAYSAMAVSMVKEQPIAYLVDPKVIAANWKYEIDIADKHNKPGKYTTIHSYEWTSAPGFANLHRNVFFRGEKVPDVIFSALNSNKPEDLWTWMEAQRKSGVDVFAISHNGNISNGLMYPMKDTYGNPIDLAYAERRMMNEPLTELMQTKGTSETHPTLSPNDEFADYELWVNILYPGKSGSF